MLGKKIKQSMKAYVFKMCDRVVRYSEQLRSEQTYEKHNIDKTVRLGKVELIGNIEIGKQTYVNNGTVLSSGEKSKVMIGNYCAIGRYVHITAKGHSLVVPTADESRDIHEHVERNTIIGNSVWIGDHVFVKHGVTVGDYAIIAASSVVINDVSPFEIVGGVPAKHIRFNKEHYKYSIK